jgi:hypothetical protein
MWKRIRHWFLGLSGASECPYCGKFAVRWHGDNPIHPDGPPIFEYWECSNCHAATPYAPSRLMDNAARKLGYRNAKELFDKLDENGHG